MMSFSDVWSDVGVMSWREGWSEVGVMSWERAGMVWGDVMKIGLGWWRGDVTGKGQG